MVHIDATWQIQWICSCGSCSAALCYHYRIIMLIIKVVVICGHVSFLVPVELTVHATVWSQFGLWCVIC